MKRILFIILFFYGLVLFPQTYKITHNGALSGEWIYAPNSNEFTYYVYSTSHENVVGSDEDKNSQLFINYMVFGGISLGASNYKLKDYYANYITSKHYTEWIEYTKSNGYISSDEYFKVKFGDNLPPEINKTKINQYDAFYFTSSENDGNGNSVTNVDVFYYFYLILDEQNGIKIEAILKTSDKRPNSVADYENMMFQHIKELQFTPNGSDASGSTSTTGIATTPDSNDEDTPWTIIIGGISAAAVAAIIRKILKKNAAKKQQNKNDDKKDEDEAHYILQLNKESVRLTLNQPETLQIQVWKVTIKGKAPVQAQISIQNTEKNLSINSQSIGIIAAMTYTSCCCPSS